MVTEVALRGRVRNEEAPRGPAASPVLSRAPQAWTPACRGPGPGFAQLSTPVRRKRLRRPGIRELGAAQGTSPDGLARGEGAHLKRGPAVADGVSAGEPNTWELSEGVSGRPPEEQAAGLLSEDWDPGLKAGHGNPEDAEDIRSCLSAEVRPWT